jgi:hypothetical protein
LRGQQQAVSEHPHKNETTREEAANISAADEISHRFAIKKEIGQTIPCVVSYCVKKACPWTRVWPLHEVTCWKHLQPIQFRVAGDIYNGMGISVLRFLLLLLLLLLFGLEQQSVHITFPWTCIVGSCRR